MRLRLPFLLPLCALGCVTERSPLANQMVRSSTRYIAAAAHEPVSWQAWGRGAFKLAARLDRPVLLYIGGDECRRCALMDHETYSDAVLGALIDSLFVPVRVDRDERPDIATRYETAIQLLTGLRGYPLTVFLLPDGSAFFGGTYFPADDPLTGRGMRQILPDVARSYARQRTFIMRQATLVRQLAFTHEAGAHGVLEPRTIAAEVEAIRLDVVSAQRSRAPLLEPPYMHALTLLLGAFVHDGDTTDLQIARGVLDYVADSGTALVSSEDRGSGGGSLAIEAGIVRNLSLGWALTGERRYRDAGRFVLASLRRALADPGERVIFADRDGYVIGSVLDAAASIGDSAAEGSGLTALDALLERNYSAGRGVRHASSWASGAPLLLQDQVQVASACLAAYNAAGEQRYLNVAIDLAAVLERQFADPNGGYFDASAPDPAAPAFADRTKPVSDDVLPGANAWAARMLLQLADATGEIAHRRRAEATLEAFAGEIPGEGMRVSSYLATAQTVIPAR